MITKLYHNVSDTAKVGEPLVDIRLEPGVEIPAAAKGLLIHRRFEGFILYFSRTGCY